MKRKHKYQDYFNAIGTYTVANPTEVNKAIWGLMKHCELELVQTKYSDAPEYVERREAANSLKETLYDLFESHCVLKPSYITGNQKVRVLRVDAMQFPESANKLLIEMHKGVTGEFKKSTQTANTKEKTL
ncbi:MAG: hypothetical protein J6J24_00130 [Clostridia bacterium]|nr:hypothetical protein [Clostridia bacterium]